MYLYHYFPSAFHLITAFSFLGNECLVERIHCLHVAISLAKLFSFRVKLALFLIKLFFFRVKLALFLIKLFCFCIKLALSLAKLFCFCVKLALSLAKFSSSLPSFS
jgi:hypothetical protein